MTRATDGFNTAATDSFVNYLTNYAFSFDRFTMDAVKDVLKTLDVPLPRNEEHYIRGTEGALIFSNTHGVVIRIERKEPMFDPCDFSRINDNPLILQPIGSIAARNAVVEICPVVRKISLPEDVEAFLRLAQRLGTSGAEWKDIGPANAGLLPLANAEFPRGIPVVIDRLSVYRTSSPSLQEQLKLIGCTEDPQEKLYGPLRALFQQALPDPARMAEFWQGCAKATAQGTLLKLTAGKEFDKFDKKGNPLAVARNYDAQLRLAH